MCDKKLCKDEDVDEYLDQMNQCIISKKVLVVADDVNTEENLRALQLPIGKHATNLDYNSKVFVNSQNWQILKNHVREFTKVDMALLDE